jgi:hypothetical protein
MPAAAAADEKDGASIGPNQGEGPPMGRLLARMAVVLLALVVPSAAQAGPYFGEWTWFWHPDKDCPHGNYSHLHYWTPQIYRVRDCLHPVNLDQYPPGPFPPVPPAYLFETFPCRTTPSAPSIPYADPVGYFGLPPAPPAAPAVTDRK